MSNADKLLQMKSRITQRQGELDKAQGAQETNLKRLKDEFGCDTMDEAETQLNELDQEVKDLEIEVEQSFKAMEEEYGL